MWTNQTNQIDIDLYETFTGKLMRKQKITLLSNETNKKQTYTQREQNRSCRKHLLFTRFIDESIFSQNFDSPECDVRPLTVPFSLLGSRLVIASGK